MEHLCLLDLARGTVFAGIWLAGVVAAFAHAAAVQTVTTALLQVEHAVVHVQHADAADQTRGHSCPFPHTEVKKGKGGGNVMFKRACSYNYYTTNPQLITQS